VTVDGATVGAINGGLLALVGFERGDDEATVRKLAARTVHMRLFADAAGRFSRSLVDSGGGVLAVPQFTLCADTRKGRRPDFTPAMPPSPARQMFDLFTAALREAGAAVVESGRFGAHMEVALVNDGPVTILLQR